MWSVLMSRWQPAEVDCHQCMSVNGWMTWISWVVKMTWSSLHRHSSFDKVLSIIVSCCNHHCHGTTLSPWLHSVTLRATRPNRGATALSSSANACFIYPRVLHTFCFSTASTALALLLNVCVLSHICETAMDQCGQESHSQKADYILKDRDEKWAVSSRTETEKHK